MSSSRERLRLQDIIDYADNAMMYLGTMSVEELTSDRKTLAAVEPCLQCLTEAAIRIGEERMAAIAPSVRLGALRGMGNRLRHAYEDMDPVVIHETVTHDLKPLRDAAIAALKN